MINLTKETNTTNLTNGGVNVMTDEIKVAIEEEMGSLLAEYDHLNSECGIKEIMRTFSANKGKFLIPAMSKHPNWVADKLQIVFSHDFERKINEEAITRFAFWIQNNKDSLLEKANLIYSYKELVEIIRRCKTLNRAIINISDITENIIINGKSVNEIHKEFEHFRAVRNSYLDNYSVVNGNFVTKESYSIYESLNNLANLIECTYENILSEELANKINEFFPEAKAVAGQKTSRIVNKILTKVGLSKLPDYNREFAKYSDAINPLKIKRHTIISVNPIDYLTMSFGNSWASCHTIDKENMRNMPNDYSGMYCGGTLSYMLDSTSVVFYTVDATYDGRDFELQPKINRCMFHIGEDKIVQGRMYPQDNDYGAEGLYKDVREVVQKVFADCFEIPNMWVNKKGTSVCGSVIASKGIHYRDYLNFSNCNVSFKKEDTEEELNRIKIIVGHSGICPCCGNEHEREDNLECENCTEDDWYCSYCDDYHSNDENCTCVEGYGDVCDYQLENSGNFIYCNYCEKWSYIGRGDNSIITEDGCEYCCTDCAIEAGYVYVESEGEWYYEDKVRYCEHCERDVLIDNWDDEHDCCCDCAEELEEETETN